MEDIEGVPEGPELYPPDHDNFIRRIDAGYRSVSDRNTDVFIQRARAEQQRRQPRPGGERPNGDRDNRV